jgi:hypothetical protein
MHMQRTTSDAAGNGLYTTIKYMRGASDIGMGTAIKHLRCTTSGAAGNGLGATMKYLRRTTSAAANNGMSTTITPPCSAASFEVNSEPRTGARPSVRLCVGPELARCVHKADGFEAARVLTRAMELCILDAEFSAYTATGDLNAVADLDYVFPEHLFFTFEDTDNIKSILAAQQRAFEDEEELLKLTRAEEKSRGRKDKKQKPQ